MENDKVENNPPGSGKESQSSVAEMIKFSLIVIAIVVPFRLFIAQPYIVEGSSMDPTFKNKDYLIVDQISMHFKDPKRGEVIIMKYPKDPTKFFIKRIIGLPNETIVITGGNVFIYASDKESGEPMKINEDYVKFSKKDDFRTTLKEGEYFVMGDNREASSDSRIWGPLPKENIVGEPILRLLPLNHIGISPGTIER